MSTLADISLLLYALHFVLLLRLVGEWFSAWSGRIIVSASLECIAWDQLLNKRQRLTVSSVVSWPLPPQKLRPSPEY